MINKLEIVKKDNGKFEVTINLDNYLSIAERRRVTIFVRYGNEDYHNYLFWYYRGTWHLVLNDLVIPIRYSSLLLKLTIVKKPQKFYLTLPELEKRELPDKKYGFPLIPNELYLYEINGKKSRADIRTLPEKIQRNAVYC